jgi:hypothetical protein
VVVATLVMKVTTYFPHPLKGKLKNTGGVLLNYVTCVTRPSSAGGGVMRLEINMKRAAIVIGQNPSDSVAAKKTTAFRDRRSFAREQEE